MTVRRVLSTLRRRLARSRASRCPTPTGGCSPKRFSTASDAIIGPMPTIRVLHFGLGPIGASIVRLVAAKPGLKIVGAVDVDPAKAGRDVGDVAGMTRRLGIRVHDNAAKALKACKPDVVIHCTSSSLKKVLPEFDVI